MICLTQCKNNKFVPGAINYHLMNCKFCNQKCIRKGKSGSIQKFQCVKCRKYQQSEYRYNSYNVEDKQIVLLTKEGCGIRSTSRILGISQTTLLRRILKIAASLKKPMVQFGKSYEVDELFTYVLHKNNRICIAYSLEQDTKTVTDIVVGKRNKQNLKKILNTLFLSDAERITTDKLNIYKELIPSSVHSTKHRGINHVERKNLTLRTHLKRLNRRTLCFSKSLVVLTAVLRIYFWA